MIKRLLLDFAPKKDRLRLGVNSAVDEFAQGLMERELMVELPSPASAESHRNPRRN